MKKGLFEKRIPTLLALFIVFVSVWITTAVIQNKALITGKASLDTNPQDILFTNITDTSFTVTFVTQEQVAAGITLDDFGGKLILDDRDQTTHDQHPYFSHHITVSGLKPNTQYEFSIISNSTVILDNGKKFTVTTASPLNTQPINQIPISGRVLLPDSSHASDTLIVLKVDGAQAISTITKNTGEFTIPTNSIRSSDLQNYFTFQENTQLQITALQKNLSSLITTIYKNSSPIPPITLSQNYDFTQTSIGTTPFASESSQLTVPLVQNTSGDIKITSPLSNATLIDQQPQIRGLAPAFQKVQLQISGTQINSTITASANGTWTFRPASPLSPGSHTISIMTQDKSGISRKVQQTFQIFSSGTQVAQTATPSATPVFTPVPTQIPTSIPTPTTIPTSSLTIIPTTIPTLAVTNTPIPTAIPPTAIPTQIIATIAPTALVINPTAIPTPRAYSTPAATGTMSTVVLSIVSTLFIITGVTLLFLLG